MTDQIVIPTRPPSVPMDLFQKLVDRKFGTERGAKSEAARELGITPGNCSNYYTGSLKCPLKYIEALAALPDYVPPPASPLGVEMLTENRDYVIQFTIELPADLRDDLELIAAGAYKKPEHTLTGPDIVLMLKQFAEPLIKSDPLS